MELALWAVASRMKTRLFVCFKLHVLLAASWCFRRGDFDVLFQFLLFQGRQLCASLRFRL